MPRLVGRKSDDGIRVLSFFVLVLVAGGAIQYYGIVDFSGLGRNIREMLQPNMSTSLAATQEWEDA